MDSKNSYVTSRISSFEEYKQFRSRYFYVASYKLYAFLSEIVNFIYLQALAPQTRQAAKRQEM